MSLKTAVGLVLIIVGVACVVWGVTEMRTLTSRFWREVGRPDYTGPIVIAAGGLIAATGVALAVSKK